LPARPTAAPLRAAAVPGSPAAGGALGSVSDPLPSPEGAAHATIATAAAIETILTALPFYSDGGQVSMPTISVPSIRHVSIWPLVSSVAGS
jgi:hypothetical protein